MSLWTPYAAEAPLDLSKPTVKQEPTPMLTLEYYPPQYRGYETTTPWGPPPGPQPYLGYQHQYQHQHQHQQLAPPPPQFSPLSGGSSCSAFDAVPAVSPMYPPVRPAPLSPPESPDSAAEKPSTRLSVSGLLTDADNLSDDPDFQAFERDALSAMVEKNGGSLIGNNPRMRRAVKSTIQDAGAGAGAGAVADDDSYRRQRERNNLAAKQSRDRRKLREIHLALKVAYLKNEVANLQAAVATRACARCQRRRRGDC